MDNKVKLGFIGAGVLCVIILTLFFASSTSIGPGQSGVMVSRFGGTVTTEVLGEGLNFHPIWVDVESYDVRVKVLDNRIPAQTSDGNSITVDVSVQYRPDPSQLGKLHKKYGPDYATTLISPTVRSIARQVSNGYGPEDLYSNKRKMFQTQITSELKKKLKSEFVIVQEVLLRDIDLGGLNESIAKKVSAQQELERERIENQRRKVEAAGRAEYQKLISGGLTDKFLRFKALKNEEKRIEAMLELAKSKNSKIIFMPAKGNAPSSMITVNGDDK